MTYAEFRRWGYRSELWRLRSGGPSKESIAQEHALTQQEINNANTQNQIAQSAQAQAAEDRAKMDALQAPLIAKETALVAGGPKESLAASMPTISKISAGYQGAKEQIMNQVPAGAARDQALAQLEIQKSTGIAGTQAQMVQQAPEILANLGSGSGAFSMQELGAALSGLSGSTTSFGAASSSNVQAGKMEADRSAAFWQPILGLANLAGNLATGGAFGAVTGGLSSVFGSKSKGSTGDFPGFGTYNTGDIYDTGHGG